MNCLSCGHDNPATVSYCRQCGQKLDLSADEIAAALAAKAQNERKDQTEFQARQALFFSVIIFVIALTLFVLSGGAPTDIHVAPSAVNGAGYVELKYEFEPPLERPLVPYSDSRR